MEGKVRNKYSSQWDKSCSRSLTCVVSGVHPEYGIVVFQKEGVNFAHIDKTPDIVAVLTPVLVIVQKGIRPEHPDFLRNVAGKLRDTYLKGVNVIVKNTVRDIPTWSIDID